MEYQTACGAIIIIFLKGKDFYLNFLINWSGQWGVLYSIQSLFEYASNSITELPHLYQVRPNENNLEGIVYPIYGASLLAILFGIFLMWAVGSEGSFKGEFKTASLISMSITGIIILVIQIKLMYYMWLSKYGWDVIREMAGFILFTPIIIFILCVPFWLIKSANKANAHGKI